MQNNLLVCISCQLNCFGVSKFRKFRLFNYVGGRP